MLRFVWAVRRGAIYVSLPPPPPPLPPTRSSPHAFALNLIVTLLFHPIITPKKDQCKGPNVRVFVIVYLIILNDRDYENSSREHIMFKSFVITEFVKSGINCINKLW